MHWILRAMLLLKTFRNVLLPVTVVVATVSLINFWTIVSLALTQAGKQVTGTARYALFIAAFVVQCSLKPFASKNSEDFQDIVDIFNEKFFELFDMRYVQTLFNIGYKKTRPVPNVKRAAILVVIIAFAIKVRTGHQGALLASFA